MSEDLIKLDGSLGEGGGQVLRIGLCLSALYKIPIEINNIRAGRPQPGLSSQHLKGVELVKEMCNAEVTGAYKGSTCLTFKPHLLQNKKQDLIADTKTAGCICLLIQVALPCALFSSKSINLILKGGTNVPFGPQIEYLQYVFKPVLEKFGANFELDVIRKGYYPQGGGEVYMRINPVHKLNGIELINSGVPTQIKGWSYVAGSVNINEAERMKSEARSTIMQELSKRDITVPPIDITTYVEPRNSAVGHGSGINLICKTSTNYIFGGSGLGSKQRTPVSPGTIAAKEVISPILMDSSVDEHLQDQIIILMVLANGPSKIKIGKNKLTSHAETAKQIAEIMLKRKGLQLSLNQDQKGSYILECNGLGLINNFLE